MRIACGTWNIQGTDPGYITRRNVKKWLNDAAQLQTAKNPYKPMKNDVVDIYAIGFQEIIPMDKSVKIPVPKIIISGADNFDLTRASIRDKVLWGWADRLVSSINRFESRAAYSLYAAYMLNGIALFIIARNELMRGEHIKNGRADTVRGDDDPTDLEIMLLPDNTSPGAVSIRFDCAGSSMAFVCAHLQGGEGLNACARRNQQYQKMASELFRDQGLTLDMHEYVFWLGDLNYTICPPATGAFTPRQAWDFVKRGQLTTLLDADELLTQRRAGVAFQGYQEGFPNFNPTFGYKPGFKSGPQPGIRQRMQMNSRGKKKDYDQYPSWSDRILWRRKGNDYTDEFHGTLVAYAMADIRISEHRPVVAIIDIEVRNQQQPPPQLQMPMPQQPMIDFRPQPMFGVNGRPVSPGPMRRIMFEPQPQAQPTTNYAFQDVPRPTGPPPQNQGMWVPVGTPFSARPMPPPSPPPQQRMMAITEQPHRQSFIMPAAPAQPTWLFDTPHARGEPTDIAWGMTNVQLNNTPQQQLSSSYHTPPRMSLGLSPDNTPYYYYRDNGEGFDIYQDLQNSAQARAQGEAAGSSDSEGSKKKKKRKRR